MIYNENTNSTGYVKKTHATAPRTFNSPKREVEFIVLLASQLPKLGVNQTKSHCLRNFEFEFFVIRKRIHAQVFGHPDVELLIKHRMYDALIIHQ